MDLAFPGLVELNGKHSLLHLGSVVIRKNSVPNTGTGHNGPNRRS